MPRAHPATQSNESLMTTDTQTVIEQFIERMGFSAQADGLPRIAGRIFGFFIMEGGACSFSELAERLQVSRGSISTNTRLLESLGVLERVARPGERQDYFQLSDDPYGRLLEGYLERMQKTQHIVAQTRQKLASSRPDIQDRLAEMAEFYRVTIDNTRQVIERWRSEQT